MLAAAERVCVYRGSEEALRRLLIWHVLFAGVESAGTGGKTKKRRDERLLFLTGMAACADAPVPAVSDQWILRGDPLAALLTLQGETDDASNDGPGNEQVEPIGEHRGGDEAGQSGEDDAKMEFLSGAHGVP